MKIELDLSKEGFHLLKIINTKGYLEYRDTEYKSVKDFLKDKKIPHDINWFMKRNSCGTLYLIYELLDLNLIVLDDNAWHLTYVITEQGKKILKQYINEWYKEIRTK
jgi:hypothetical protein